jgi:hypothetical protein
MYPEYILLRWYLVGKIIDELKAPYYLTDNTDL